MERMEGKMPGRKSIIFAILLFLAIALLIGCASAPKAAAQDYTGYTYDDYEKLSWDDKETAYQFSSASDTGAVMKWFPAFVELFTDGSARVTELSLAPEIEKVGYGRWEIDQTRLVVRYYRASGTEALRIRIPLEDTMSMPLASRFFDGDLKLTGGAEKQYASRTEFLSAVRKDMQYTVRTSLPDKEQYSVACIGDSITAGAKVKSEECYATLLGEQPWISQSNNYGIDSSTIVRASEYAAMNSLKPVLCFVDRPLHFEETSDVVFIFGGTNDFGLTNYPMGSIDDTDDTTFYGALNCLVARISAFCPDSLIVFATPIQRIDRDIFEPNIAGYTLSDYCDAIKAIAQKYGLSCIDLYSFEKMQASDPAYGELLADGLHPNAQGHILLAEKIASELHAILFD